MGSDWGEENDIPSSLIPSPCFALLEKKASGAVLVLVSLWCNIRLAPVNNNKKKYREDFVNQNSTASNTEITLDDQEKGTTKNVDMGGSLPTT